MVSAQVVDGILQQKVNSTDAEKKKSSNSSMDKDAFLKLLVAQMKYQDPLEPTSNTEYISQFATFSELEQMQNMSSTMELTRASALIGQTVIVQKTNDNGVVSQDMGVVDYISFENGKAKIWVNGNSYDLDEVVEIDDNEYIEAVAMATTLVNAIKRLPPKANLTISDREAVEAIQKLYESMNEYQRSFVASDVVDAMNDYIEKMDELIKLSELAADNNKEEAGNGDEVVDGDEIVEGEG